MTRTGSAGIWLRTSPATRIKDVPGDTEAGSRTQREIACLRNSQACLTRFVVRWRSKRRLATFLGRRRRWACGRERGGIKPRSGQTTYFPTISGIRAQMGPKFWRVAGTFSTALRAPHF